MLAVSARTATFAFRRFIATLPDPRRRPMTHDRSSPLRVRVCVARMDAPLSWLTAMPRVSGNRCEKAWRRNGDLVENIQICAVLIAQAVPMAPGQPGTTARGAASETQ